MKITLPYGNAELSAELDWADCLGTLDVADVPAIADVPAAVHAAIQSPIGAEGGLWDKFRPGERVAIVVSDAFRFTGVDQYLPLLLDELARTGIEERDVSIVFSTGTHRPPTEEEKARIVGEAIYRRLEGQLFSHDANDDANLVSVGTTSRGTPVQLNRRVVECDRVIATGSVVLHYFGGFGGGRKSIVPGVAGVATIARNHSLNLDPHEDRLNPDVRIGLLDGNPVAEDMLEAARFCLVDFIVNTVLNRRGKVAAVFAGEMDAAHRAAAQRAHEIFAVPIRQRADLVVASAGAAKNFIQSHKALFNAYQALKPGGRIVFLCPCPEGLGNERFRHWLGLGSREAIIAELRKNAEINGQTALSTIEKAAQAIVVTEMGGEDVQALGAQRETTLGDALAYVRSELSRAGVTSPTCYLMPSASYCVPVDASGAERLP